MFDEWLSLSANAKKNCGEALTKRFVIFNERNGMPLHLNIVTRQLQGGEKHYYYYSYYYDDDDASSQNKVLVD